MTELGRNRKYSLQTKMHRVFIMALLCVVSLSLLQRHSAFATTPGQPLLTLTDGKQKYLLGTYIEYLEDPQGKLSLEQVRSAEYETKFTRGTQDVLNFGLTDSVYWLRLRIRNDAPVTTQWRLELSRPSMNTVVLYLPQENGSSYNEKKTGYIYPFSSRDVPHESFVFHLPLTPHAEQVIYLRVRDKAMELPLRVWEADAMEQRDQTSRLLIGLSFGALIIMFIYNLVLTIMVKDRGFVFHALFQISILLYLGNVQAYAQRYLWPELTYFNTFTIPLSVELTLIGILLFGATFLRINEAPKAWKIPYRVLLTTLILCILPTPFIGAKILDVVLPTGLVVLMYIPVMAVRAWLGGYTPARFYLLSWTFFLLTGFGVTLERMGLFTVTQLIPEQALQVGAVYIVAFQSVALADRFNLYKQETINAQAALVEKQQEMLKLQNTLTETLESARVELEQKVQERTQAITEINKKLELEVKGRKRAQQAAELLARIDPLTGLFNRRHFSQLADMEFSKAVRYSLPLSILIFDVDHFKDVNDTFGHQIGDKALIHVSHIFQQHARKSDVLARYGGEEFVALLPNTDFHEAEQTAERLRQMIEDAMMLIDGQTVRLTVSIGVATNQISSEIEDLGMLLKNADAALYEAKHNGRNRVIAFTNK
jgi:two-component system, sensor histidine kinase LadS